MNHMSRAHLTSRGHLTGRCDCAKMIRRGSNLPGAALNSCGSQLTEGIDDLKEKRDEIKKLIQMEEEEKACIQRDLGILSRRLAQVEETLANRYSSISDYDKTIQEAESAYLMIMESSQSLLNVLKQESRDILHKV